MIRQAFVDGLQEVVDVIAECMPSTSAEQGRCEAQRRGLRVLDGHVLYDNTAVLGLLRTSGRPLDVAWHGGDVLEIKLRVEA